MADGGVEWGNLMKFDGKLEGFAEFDKLLKTLPRNVENRVLQGAVNAAARVGYKAIKAAAPVHKIFQSVASKKYGPLKKNLRVVTSKKDKKRGKRGAYITTGDAFWAYIYEKGSRNQPARPWMLPAFKASYVEMLKALQDRLGAGIIREATKQTASGKAVREQVADYLLEGFDGG